MSSEHPRTFRGMFQDPNLIGCNIVSFVFFLMFYYFQAYALSCSISGKPNKEEGMLPDPFLFVSIKSVAVQSEQIWEVAKEKARVPNKCSFSKFQGL
ncbi:unnamed protein product [Ixodes persulcatus]